jgi:hypothetical protein
MLIAIAIIIAVILLFILTREKDDELIEVGTEPMYDDEDLAKLKVFYKGNEVQRNEVITVYEPFNEFSVEGYNLKGERKVLWPQKLYWSCSCQVVKFENQTGLTNVISCKYKGDLKRSISVKYQNGVTAIWKIRFKE